MTAPNKFTHGVYGCASNVVIRAAPEFFKEDQCEGYGFPIHTIFLRDHTYFRQCLHF